MGLTLVEITLVLSVLGVLLAVLLPAFFHALRASKISEAPNELQRIYLAAAAYYATPQATPAGKRVACLPASAGPTPSRPSAQPLAVDFAAKATPGAATWSVLRYQPEAAIRYRYTLLSDGAGCGSERRGGSTKVVLRLRAEGDLDSDGILSTFERDAHLDDGELAQQPVLRVHDRTE